MRGHHGGHRTDPPDKEIRFWPLPGQSQCQRSSRTPTWQFSVGVVFMEERPGWANEDDLFVDLEHDGVTYQVPPSVKERFGAGPILLVAWCSPALTEAKKQIFACLANYPVIPDTGNFTGNFTGNTAAISRYLVIALSYAP